MTSSPPLALAPDHFLALERHARFALRLFNISEREVLVAHVVVDHTYAIGRAFAVIPVRVFAMQTGIAVRDFLRKGTATHPAHVGVLVRLVRKRLIEAHDEADTYSFQSDTSLWQAARRHVAGSVIQEVLPAILDPARDFKAALLELGREKMLASLGGNPPPESGTGTTDGVYRSTPDTVVHILPGLPGTRITRSTRPVEIPATRVGGNSPPNESDDYWMHQLRSLLGSEEIERNGGLWRIRLAEAPLALREALSAVKLQRDRGGFRTSAAAYATKCYREERSKSRKEVTV